MLAESFVAVMALVAASVIEPGIHFAMNSPPALVGSTPQAVAQTLSTWGFVITPDVLTQTAKDVGETTILARAGGAPTLAVGTAHILHQVVAARRLLLGTVELFRMKRERYAWVTAAPAAWLLICTLTAGWQKVFSSEPKVGFLSNADKYADAIAAGQLLAPAESVDEMSRIVFKNRLDAGLCLLFMAVVLSVLVYSVRAALAARSASKPTTHETPYEPLPAGAAS